MEEKELEQKIKDYFKQKIRELLPNEENNPEEEVVKRINPIYFTD
jgi:hypothetical protein